MKSNLAVVALALGLALFTTTAYAVAAEGSGDPGAALNPVSFEHLRAETAVWTAVLFLVLLGVLWKFAWGPLAAGLDKRESSIAGQIEQAAQANEKAQELLGQYEQKLADAKGEVRDIIEQGRRDAERVGEEMLEKARQEAQAEQERALKEIDAATADALSGLAEKSADLAVSLAGKIVDSKLDPKAHASLIERAVSDFSSNSPK